MWARVALERPMAVIIQTKDGQTFFSIKFMCLALRTIQFLLQLLSSFLGMQKQPQTLCKNMGETDCVPIKLNLQTQALGWVWPTGCSFLAPHSSERLVGWARVRLWGCGEWLAEGGISEVESAGFAVEREARWER